jgi:DNA ligase (NAD+)
MSEDILSTPSAEVFELRSVIRKHNRLYYDLDTPEIEDVKYDSLVTRLKSLSPDDPVLNEMGNPTFATKVEHSALMGSLDKVHTIEEIESKFPNQEVCIMPKVDGLSLAVRYSGCNYDWAATRGNGKIGELVTPNAARINGLPLSIEFGSVEVRGEAFIARTDFYGIMDQPGYDDREDGYANPRNAAAGAIRQKDPKETYNRHIGYVAYKVVGDVNFADQSDVLLWLNDNGFKTVDFWVATVGTDNISAIIENIRTSEFDYNIDGAVVMLNNLDLFEEAGHGSKCPKGAVAFKYETEQVQSVARKIDWEANRSGRIVPTLNVDKTEIDGTMVSRMSLHNYGWMLDRDVAIGDTVLFTKANEIIPYLTEVVNRVVERDMEIPISCPSCDGPIRISYHEVTKDGKLYNLPVDLMCDNDICPAKFVKHIRRILQILEVKGIDEKTLVKMDAAGLLSNVWDIFDITTEALVAKGFGKGESPKWVKSVNNITTTPQCLLATMGIIGWGRRMFEITFNDTHWSSEEWVNFVTNEGSKALSTDLSWMSNIDGIGTERIIKLRHGINDRWQIANEISQRVAVEYPEVIMGGTLAGKSFCCTGTLTRKRNEIQADIIAAGGEIKSGVSKNLDYLVAGESAGSKLTKAQAAGVTILTEDELVAMI